MKPTQTEIERLLLAYHPHECVKIKELDYLIEPKYYCHIDYESKYGVEIEYIELRSIDSLTDEEVTNFSELDFLRNAVNDENNGCYGMSVLGAFFDYGYHKFEFLAIEDVDYVRSIGIALPFAGYTVEQWLESGILKIKG